MAQMDMSPVELVVFSLLQHQLKMNVKVWTATVLGLWLQEGQRCPWAPDWSTGRDPSRHHCRLVSTWWTIANLLRPRL